MLTFAQELADDWPRTRAVRLLQCSMSASSPHEGPAGGNVRIRFYGRFAELIGPALEIDVIPPCPISDVRRHIAEHYPEMADRLTGKHAKACVADQIVGDDYIVQQGQQVEILAPLSGG